MPGIKVKLVRSRAGRSHDQLATLKGLGLYRMNQERILPDTPATIGMCKKLQHLIEWEKVAEEPTQS
ncbi:MAG: 50S ribosomal protein L30 [Myxococcaceae bacterium]|nr:50S ribosomal protein L30 [Myxococcaceae bacterium]